MPLYRFLAYLLQRRWDAAGVEPPVHLVEDYPWMARRLFRATRRPRFGDPRVVAFELEITVICSAVLGCYGEICEGNTIIYSCRGGEPSWGLRVYHGLAHWVLETWYCGEYTEADAWLLTVELAWPGAWLLEVTEDDWDQQRYAPFWLAALYLQELQELATRRAVLQAPDVALVGHLDLARPLPREGYPGVLLRLPDGLFACPRVPLRGALLPDLHPLAR
jgi:hypothetical protein